MPAATVSVKDMVKLLVSGRLYGSDDARSIYQRWQSEASDPEDSDQFRKFLVQKRYLTDYQSTLLARGMDNGYFIGPYKVLERIGKGRMAGVYKAQHEAGQLVALKVLPPSKAKDPQLLARFLREGRLLPQLSHPNLVRCFEVGESEGLNYIAMEYLEGETLEEVLARRQQLTPPEAARIAFQALQGLQQVHDRGMVHRDIKPGNLMLISPPTPSGAPPATTLTAMVKLLDIGLGRSLFDENSPGAEPDGQLTTDGVLLGTPDYLAPEQAKSAHSADIRADIYSMGCVMFHMLAGRPPFPDSNVLNQLIRHATEPPPPLVQLNPAVPEGLQQVINWMMAKDPSQRYPTPERAAMALQMFLPPPEPAPPAAMPVPATMPAVQSGQIPSAQPAATASQKTGESIKLKRKEVPVAEAVPAKPAKTRAREQPETYDVELVAAPLPDKDRFRQLPKRLDEIDRRDWFMLGVGGIGVFLAIVFAYILASLIRRRPEETNKTDEPSN